MRRKTLATAATGLVLALGLTACGDDDSVSSDERERASAAAIEAVGGGQVTDVGRGDGDDNYEYDVEVQLENGNDIDVELDEDFNVTNNPPQAAASQSPSAVPSSAAPSAAPSASASPSIDDDAPLTGQTLERASAAAIEAAGGGRVTDSNASDDADHAYEVEVRLDNNEDVDVELDEQFNVTNVDR
ncbi:MAG: hypothetical protein Q7T56_18310 [Nocardioidaceae bacterium]|nr:hypothetical protein [Nocardioidaceae bacterium]